VGCWSETLLFDIVNGFLKSMPRGVGLERSDGRKAGVASRAVHSRFNNLAEIKQHPHR